MERALLKQIIADRREYRPPKEFFQRAVTETIERFADNPNIMSSAELEDLESQLSSIICN